jgi:hypothetical protein
MILGDDMRPSGLGMAIFRINRTCQSVIKNNTLNNYFLFPSLPQSKPDKPSFDMLNLHVIAPNNFLFYVNHNIQ